jgi:(E)-4-hydroxy-3-methylbut-2-enyl-diphosphate synthase
MVESALEFARIARELNYHSIIFSMKASNPKVMIAAYRLLAARLAEAGPDWNYPLHLGVTEAGDGEDGRIKSAIGIGSLLADGLGDTIRVSLTEDSVHEIPVAKALVKRFAQPEVEGAKILSLSGFDPFSYNRRPAEPVQAGECAVGGKELVRVAIRERAYEQIAHKIDRLGDFQPEFLSSEAVPIDPRNEEEVIKINTSVSPLLVTVADGLDLPVIDAFRLLNSKLQSRHPILLKDTLVPSEDPQREFLATLVESAATVGSLLCDGIGDAVLIQGEEAPGQSLRLSYNILQAAGARIFKTDYVACPSCGRTLFNLQTTTARIKAATDHLKGVKIAIMGCIVNGPGEMADADFGYVGGAPGKVNLYVGKKAVKFNIPESEAVERLTDLIKEHGRWIEPQPSPVVV